MFKKLKHVFFITLIIILIIWKYSKFKTTLETSLVGFTGYGLDKDNYLETYMRDFYSKKCIDGTFCHDIFNNVRKEHKCKLLMIGDGPERVAAEQMCRKYGISKDVKFLGKLKLIENILSFADVFILPSETESFGLVALEAMASKTAVISTNINFLPTWLTTPVVISPSLNFLLLRS